MIEGERRQAPLAILSIPDPLSDKTYCIATSYTSGCVNQRLDGGVVEMLVKWEAAGQEAPHGTTGRWLCRDLAGGRGGDDLG